MKPHLPGSVRAATRAYAWTLRLTAPDALREAHAPEMVADFQALAAEAHGERGLAGVLAALARAAGDVVAYRADTARDPFRRGRRLDLRANAAWLLRELRYAARTTARRPGFTLVALLTLALGIGANVAMFAVVNSVLLRPLPYPESERIVTISHHAPGLNLPELNNSAATLEVYRHFARSFSSLGAYQRGERNLIGATTPARLEVLEVTPSLFDVLRVRPALGRRFVEADAGPVVAPVAILTHSAWTAHFGGRRDILGSTIRLNGVATEVVGVMPRDFVTPERDVSVLLPYWVNPDDGLAAFGLRGLARLAPGVSVDAAAEEVAALQPRMSELYPDITAEFLREAGWSATLETLHDSEVGDVRTALWIVLGTVGLLLLVACASVANLFMVRAEARQKEFAVRLALGATRARVATTFLLESLLLGSLGGAWGLLLAGFALRALVAAGPAQLPRLHEISLDARVILFGMAISVLAGLVFGVLPLPMHARRPVGSLIREGRGQSGGADRQRVRKALIVAQVALALVLVTGSVLMLRSFVRLQAVDPGIRPADVLVVGVSVGEDMPKPQAAARYQRLLDSLEARPEVVRASAINALPFDPSGINGSSFQIRSRPRAEGALPPVTMFAAVAPGYFEAIGTTLLEGRGPERRDHEHARAVAWVSETFAREILDGRALGEEIQLGTDTTWHQIVGVVQDARFFGLREEMQPMAYLPMTTPVETTRLGLMHVVVRTRGNPLSFAPAARELVRRLDPQVPLTTTRTMQSIVDDSVAETSFTMTVLLIAAIVSLLLGGIGLYGVIGYVVAQRTQEIGVRIALGAAPGTVLGMVLWQGLMLAVVGLAIGLAAALALTRMVESLLYEVTSRDPAAFVVAPLVLLAVSALAVYLPARRAAAVSPMQALRAE